MEGRELKHGETRIIKVNKEAIHELVQELFMERGGKYFNLRRNNEVDHLYQMEWDDITGDFACVICNFDERNQVDLDQLMESMDYTADTFFSKKCYRSIQLEKEEINEQKFKSRSKTCQGNIRIKGGIRADDKDLECGEARFIKVNKEAVHELVRELFMERRGKKYFDLRSSSENHYLYQMKWNDETGDFVCVVCNFDERNKVDLDRLMESIDYTTDTFFSAKRYRSIQLEEEETDK